VGPTDTPRRLNPGPRNADRRARCPSFDFTWDWKGAVVLRGDLESTPLPDLLRRLADAKATGCVYVLPAHSPAETGEASIALRDGAICGVSLPGTEDAVAVRLVASRRLSPAALDEARQAQETDLSSWLLSELLVHLGLAEESLVQEFMVEQALSDLTLLCELPSGGWRFRRRERWRATLTTPLPAEEILEAALARRAEWRELLPTISGADAVVSLAGNPAADEGAPASDASAPQDLLELDADSYALLCAVDGVCTVAQLGHAAGLTQLAVGRTIAKLVTTGLVWVTPAAGDGVDGADRSELEDVELPLADDVPSDGDGSPPLDAIAAALSFEVDGPLLPADVGRGFAPVGATWQAPRTARTDPLADALARVSAALTGAMEDANPPATGEIAEPTPLELVAGVAPEAAPALEEPAAPEEPAEPFTDDEAAPIADVVPLVRPIPQHEILDEPADLEVEHDTLVAEAALPPAPPPAAEAFPADAALLLSQFTEETEVPDDVPADVPEDVPAAVAAEEPPPAVPSEPEPTRRRDNGLTDTAALLRELSSLGADSDAPSPRPAAARTAAARPVSTAAAQHAKKRKGLFGRS
jgi:hypothetical protein